MSGGGERMFLNTPPSTDGCPRDGGGVPLILLRVKLSRAEPSPFLCKQCELVQKMLPGGREALKRSVGGFAGAGRVVRTCYRVA